MKIVFLPKSRMGKIAFGLIIYFAAFLAGFFILAYFGIIGDEEMLFDERVDYACISAYFAATSAFIVGLFAVFKKKDRSVSVLFSILIGLIVLIFFIWMYIQPEEQSQNFTPSTGIFL